MEQSIATCNLDFPLLWENSLYISLPTSITMNIASFDIKNIGNYAKIISNLNYF